MFDASDQRVIPLQPSTMATIAAKAYIWLLVPFDDGKIMSNAPSSELRWGT
jgi:hypothetical protein